MVDFKTLKYMDVSGRMNNQRLSHSAASVYLECSMKYKLHYINKLRSSTTGSALLFGTAVDKALELALQQFPNAKEIDVKNKFLKHWINGEINGEQVEIETSPLIKWSKADSELDENPWASMLQKGYLIIEAYFKDILPNIEQVLATQEEISLVNDNGDAVIGFTDAVLKWKGYDVPIIFDFKTAGRPYAKDAVTTSPQLTLYKHALSAKYNTTTAGFIVFLKTIKKKYNKYCAKCKYDGSDEKHTTCSNMVNGKRCKGEWTVTQLEYKAETRVLIDKIDESFENKVLESFDLVNTQLQQSVFEKNFKACWGKYGPCQFMKYCKSGDMDGLIQKVSQPKTS